MRLWSITLRNFRCFREETTIDFNDFTLLIGANEAGKSSVLDALEGFFEGKIDQDDICVSADGDAVEITCIFDDLPSELVLDAEHATTLEDEHLLNKDGMLEIKKEYAGKAASVKEKATYLRALHPTAENMDDLLTLKIGELRERAEAVGVDTDQTNMAISSEIRRAIWETTDDLAAQEVDIQIDDIQAKDFSRQLNQYMPSYALFKSDRPSTDQDDEAQDPLKAAVTEALRGLQNRLDEIQDEVHEQVGRIASETVQKLKEMAPDLASELSPRFKEPKWDSVFKISLTGDEDVPINKRGSGVRRLILLNFFRAKAEKDATAENKVGVIYAIEEPETSQHPDNQRLLLHSLEELSCLPTSQVIITTHSPNLARLAPASSIRYLKLGEGGTREVISDEAGAAEMAARALGVMPDHDVELFLGVEGVNDENFLKGISSILCAAGESIPDLDALADEGRIIFFPVGGSNLAHWASRLQGLNRPEYYIFDRDNAPPDPPKYQEHGERLEREGDCTVIHTGKRELENYIHPSAIQAVNPDVEIQHEAFDNVPQLVARAVHEASESPNTWDDLNDEKIGKKESRAKLWLNRDAVRRMTPSLLSEIDEDGDIRSWLAEIGTRLTE